MASDSLSQRKAKLDKTEREHLKSVVADMRDRVEANVEFQLTQHGFDDDPEDCDALDEDVQELVEAIELLERSAKTAITLEVSVDATRGEL